MWPGSKNKHDELIQSALTTEYPGQCIHSKNHQTTETNNYTHDIQVT